MPSSLTTYKNLKVLSTVPIGAAGLALNDNFLYIAEALDTYGTTISGHTSSINTNTSAIANLSDIVSSYGLTITGLTTSVTNASNLTSGTLAAARLPSTASFANLSALSNASNNVPLTLKGFAGQSANLLEVKNSGNAITAKIDPLGNLTAQALTVTYNVSALGFYGGRERVRHTSVCRWRVRDLPP